MADHVIWYKNESDWQAFKELCEDKDHFGSSYEEWVSSAQSKIDVVACKGITLVKVDVDPVKFALWCKENELPATGHSRSRFVAESMAGNSGGGA